MPGWRWRRTLRGRAAVTGTLLLLLAAPGELYGYLDPGTGSLLVQLAAAAVFGSLLTIKQSWRRITGLFRGTAPEAKPPEEPRGS